MPKKATEIPNLMVFHKICRVNSSEKALKTMAFPLGRVEKIRMLASGRRMRKKTIAATMARATFVKMSYLAPLRFELTSSDYLSSQETETFAIEVGKKEKGSCSLSAGPFRFLGGK